MKELPTYKPDFEEYIRQGEPDKKERAQIWRTAIGLQQVDGGDVTENVIEKSANVTENVTEKLTDRRPSYGLTDNFIKVNKHR